MTAKKDRPLVTRLRAGRMLMQDWRRVLVDSHRDVEGLLPAAEQHELKRFDEAIAAMNEAVRTLK